MFHLMLGLPVLVILVIVISILLFGLFALIASLVGGASTAALVKNKLSRRLLLTGFAILSLTGLLPLLPFIMAYISVPFNYVTAAVMVMLISVAVLAVVGIRFSRAIKNKLGKTALTILFCIILIFAIFLTVLAPIIGNFLLSL